MRINKKAESRGNARPTPNRRAAARHSLRTATAACETTILAKFRRRRHRERIAAKKRTGRDSNRNKRQIPTCKKILRARLPDIAPRANSAEFFFARKVSPPNVKKAAASKSQTLILQEGDIIKNFRKLPLQGTKTIRSIASKTFTAAKIFPNANSTCAMSLKACRRPPPRAEFLRLNAFTTPSSPPLHREPYPTQPTDSATNQARRDARGQSRRNPHCKPRRKSTANPAQNQPQMKLKRESNLRKSREKKRSYAD